jgi:hypothetical protein
MDFRDIGLHGVDWNHLAQDRDRQRAFVNTLMNLKVPQKLVVFSLAERLSTSQKGSCSSTSILLPPSKPSAKALFYYIITLTKAPTYPPRYRHHNHCNCKLIAFDC